MLSIPLRLGPLPRALFRRMRIVTVPVCSPCARSTAREPLPADETRPHPRCRSITVGTGTLEVSSARGDCRVGGRRRRLRSWRNVGGASASAAVTVAVPSFPPPPLPPPPPSGMRPENFGRRIAHEQRRRRVRGVSAPDRGSAKRRIGSWQNVGYELSMASGRTPGPGGEEGRRWQRAAAAAAGCEDRRGRAARSTIADGRVA